MSQDLVTRIKRLAAAVGVLSLFGLIVLVSAWNMVFHYVEPDELLVVISKTGDELAQGELLAKPGQKGPLEDVLGEGRHFITPVLYEVESYKLADLNMVIAPFKIGVVKAKVGKPLPADRILADEGERGIRRTVLPPGRHRLNPRAYEVEIRDATLIKPGYVGFVTRLVGDEPKGKYSGPGEKGILEEVLQPGLYYLNPYEYSVREVEIGVNQISFLDREQISFPSADAFAIRLDATVEWELEPGKVPPVIDEFGARSEIEQKVLIAQSRSIGRLEGSRYGAKDFLLGEGREKIQTAFTTKLEEKCREKYIEVHSAYIRHISIPQNLLEPIRQAVVAQEMEQTAKVQELTRKSAADLEREQQLIEQRRQEVRFETQALIEQIKAEAEREVGQIEAETRRLVAEKQQEIAKLEAQRTELLGTAQAQVKQLLGEAEASRFALKVAAFGGDSDAFARFAFAESLPPQLRIHLVQTGEGTFWTDLQGRGDALWGKLLEDGKAKEPARPAARGR